MKNAALIAGLLLTLSLAACEKPTTVVNVPPPAEPVAGPAGATGATGMAGPQGASGASGKQGDTTVIVVTPPASAVQN
jgi:hypothetical protein